MRAIRSSISRRSVSSWLYRHSEVLSREPNEDGRLALSVRADSKNAEMVKHKYPGTTEIKPTS